ncbi:MAG: endo-1,4-beta-xylanase [Verrucomicrobiota bacterium]
MKLYPASLGLITCFHLFSALLLPVAAQDSPTSGVSASEFAKTEESPWGICTGAEWRKDFPKVNPLLQQAGVTWLRGLAEWNGVEPKKGQWNWKFPDALVANAREHGIHVNGTLGYAARWATTDGSTRTVPLKNNQDWSDYCRAIMSRYQDDIDHWEVWNEFNGSFSKGGTPEIYAELVARAHEEGKKINPDMKIGMTVANFSVGFLDQSIKAGAKGKFDYVCVHPYENLGALRTGGDMGFLSLAGSLRKMLRDNGEDPNMPLWITEIGVQSTIKPNAKRDAEQADLLVKCYVICLAQGFDKVFWFEARGPAYGKDTDHGLIRKNWSKRPVYHAFAKMTEIMGPVPEYLGWLDIDEGGFGFVFQGADGPVLCAWAPYQAKKAHTLGLEAGMEVLDVLGRKTAAAGRYRLARPSVWITGLPEAMVAKAKANRDQPFPWGKDYSVESVARIFLGATNREEGISMKKPEKTTSIVHGLDWSARRANWSKGKEGNYMYFRVDPTFAGFGNKKLAITVVARRDNPDKEASMSLLYESLDGYRAVKKNGKQVRFELPPGEDWTEHTWVVDNANFVGGWGYNFRTDANGSKSDFQVREVRVEKLN